MFEKGKLRELPFDKGLKNLAIRFYANPQLTELTKELALNIQKEQKENPLKSPLIVVPNLNLIPWLKLELPKHASHFIQANLEFTFLEKAILKSINESNFIPNWEEGEQLLTNDKVQKLIFQYLYLNKTNLLGIFPILKTYFEKISGMYYLSEVLVRYFKDYELNRAEWIIQWGKENGINFGDSFYKTPIPEELKNDIYYQFQTKVYTDLFILQNQNKLFFQLLNESKDLNIVGNIHLFCLSNLSGTFVHFFHQIAGTKNSKFNINFYQFHTGLFVDSKLNANTYNISGFAKPQNYLTHEFSKYGKVKPSIQTDVSSVLKQLKAISQGEKISDSLLFKDQSVRVWNAPSVYREVESIAFDILSKVKESEGKLTLLNFAILVPNMKEYRPAIEWVFDGGLYISKGKDVIPELIKIPYSLTDLSAAETSKVYKALSVLFRGFLNRRFEKSDLDLIFTNALITGISDNDELNEELLLLLENLGVVFEEEDNFNPYTISYGIYRSLLSVFAEENFVWETYKEVTPEIQSQSLVLKLVEIWSKIKTLKENLTNFLNNPKSNFPNLEKSFVDFFEFSEENEDEFSLFGKWLRSLEDWVTLPWKQETDFYETLHIYTDSVFLGIPFTKGNYLTTGVTISLLQPMRPIPFEHIYVLGLGEGKFPGSNDNSRLNLRKFDHYPWDLTRREIQESLLWETIQSAGQSITFSYVGKNTKEDKEFEPCSTLFEIMKSIDIQTATTIPLHSHSNKYPKDFPVPFDHSRNLFSSNSNRLNPLVTKPPFSDPKKINQPKIDEIQNIYSPKQLKKLIENPLLFRIQKELGLYISENEEEEITEEHFSLSSLETYKIKSLLIPKLCQSLNSKEIWPWGEEKISSITSEIILREKKSARFPFGGFSLLEEKKITEEILEISQVISHLSTELKGTKKDYIYHKNLTWGDVGIREARILEPPNLELVFPFTGEWEDVVEIDRDFIWLYKSKLSPSPQTFNAFQGYAPDFFAKRAEIYISACLLKLLDFNFTLYTLSGIEKKHIPAGSKITFPGLTKKTANEYLTLVVDLLQSEEMEYFPKILLNDFFASFHVSYLTDTPLSAEFISTLKENWESFSKDKDDILFSNESKLLKLSTHHSRYRKSFKFEKMVPLYLPLLNGVKFQ